MNEWNIQARSHACQACGREFADQDVYHTLLFDLKNEWLRQDVCAACWQLQFSEGARDRKGFVSHWQGVFEVPPPAAPEPIQKGTAETLLRKLTELNNPQYAAAAYILAVMLERKRLLKVKEQYRREDQRVFVYEHAKSAEVFTIPDPDLQLDQLEQVQRDVAQLLEHGLAPPETVAPPPAPGSADADAPGLEPPGNAVAAMTVGGPATDAAAGETTSWQPAPAPEPQAQPAPNGIA